MRWREGLNVLQNDFLREDTQVHAHLHVRTHTHIPTESLDIVLTLECGSGMQGRISFGDQILAVIKLCLRACVLSCLLLS